MDMGWISLHGKRLLRGRPVAGKRLTALLLCAALLAGLLPLAFAEEEGGVCPNHPRHDESCGYREELVVTSPCAHVHDETCGYVEAAPGAPCDRDCMGVDESGELIHEAGCAYEAPTEERPCTHVHDTACGYAEELRVVSPCAHTCELCAPTEPEETKKPDAAPTPPMLRVPAVPIVDAAEHAPTNVTNQLKYETTVTYRGKEIGDNATVELRDNDTFSVKVAFEQIKLWEHGLDDSVQLIFSKDFANFPALAVGFGFSDTEIPLTCDISTDGGNREDVTIGTVTFSEDSTNSRNITATLTFSDEKLEDKVFGVDGIDTIDNAYFTFKLSYAKKADAEEGSKETVSILGKRFEVEIPMETRTYQVTKTGTADLATQTITWNVEVTGTKGDGDAATPMNLAGYRFSDDLTRVGDYKSGSFRLGAATSAPEPDADYTDGILTYTFPVGSTSPQTIEFKTAIPDANYYANGTQHISNTAKLFLDDEELASNSHTVDFTPEWIEKKGEPGGTTGSGGETKPEDRTITWTITANHNGASLNGAFITDTLNYAKEQKPLELASATIQEWDSSSSKWGEPSTIAITGKDAVTTMPNGWKFQLGDISSKILLKITTKVPPLDNGSYLTGKETYKNSALIGWTARPGGIGSNEFGVTIGYNAITKAATGYSPKDATIDWKVGVNANGQAITDMKVYDLLVYGDKALTAEELKGLTNFPTDAVSKLGDITQNLNQKYADTADSFFSTDLEVTKTTLSKDGTPVADLLVVTSKDGAAISTDKAYSFTLKTQVMNPHIFAANEPSPSSVSNTAVLFSGNAKLNAATAIQEIKGQILAKDALTVEAAKALEAVGGQTADNANGSTDANDKIFNYVDKSVVFRLVVNKNGMNMADVGTATNKAAGEITLTDTLPEGWVFQKIAGDKDYLIFVGDTNGKATGEPLTACGDLSGTPVFVGQRSATFQFSNLPQPYVILVKAGPTVDTAKGYFNKNDPTAVENKATLDIAGWSVEGSDTQKIKINSMVLDKQYKKTDGGDGSLTWTVDYNPYLLEQAQTENLAIEDTLPIGVDLRIDSTGKPLLEGNVTVHALTLKSDGTYDEGEKIPLTLGENIFYNNDSRVLRFQIANPVQGCRLSYVTDVTGDSGTLSNTVKLTSNAFDGSVHSEETYTIDKADAAATLGRSGYVIITKTDKDGAGLSGAEFTIFTEDGKTPIRRGSTGANGVLTLRGLPDGQYLLRETKPPASYVLLTYDYPVEVRDKVAYVNGQTDRETAKRITIKNVKTGTVGNLIVTKEVTGNLGELDREFEFTLTLPNGKTYSYLKNGAIMGDMIGNGSKFHLKNGDSLTILDIDKETPYTVTEDDYTEVGYVTTKTGDTGTIKVDETSTAAFTNDKTVYGKVVITKVAAEGENKPLRGAVFQVTGPDGTAHGSKVTTDDTGKAEISNLPLFMTLTLTELTPPAEYQTAAPQTFTITDDPYTLEITVKNTLIPPPPANGGGGGGGGGGGNDDDARPSPSPEVSPAPSPEIPPIPSPDPAVSPEPSPSAPPAQEGQVPETPEAPAEPVSPPVIELPNNGIRGEIRPDNPRYTLDGDGVPHGIPPVPDPDYWLDDAGIPLGFRNEEGEWEWIEDEAVPLGFLNPQGEWVDFVPQTGDSSALLILLFGLSGAAVLSLTGVLVSRRRGKKRS